ncbi:MAG: hypothetical protein OXI61_15415 [Candidatus Poribacteria bacterium]|nr:hypothetical protein [Candidatus Poribacteria bacterium]
MKRILFLLMVLFNSSLLIINVWGSGKISFTSDSTGNLDIYIIDIDGKNLVNLTNHPSDDFSPTWSPDGRAFAYVSNRDGNPEIYVMNTDAGQICEEPDGSPDGQGIAYVSVQDANKDIYLIRAARGGLRKLTQDPGLEFSPAWVPSAFSVSLSAHTQMVLWGILKQTKRKK